MKTYTLLVILVILFSSCSSTLLVKNSDSAYEKLNSRLKNEKCEITLTNGEISYGKYNFLQRDSLTWQNANNPEKTITIPISMINKIETADHIAGMGKGMWFGVLFGGVVGSLIGLSKENSGSSGGQSGWGGPGKVEDIAGLPTLIGLISGTSAGFLLGGSYGVIHGERETFLINDPIQSSEKFYTIEIEEILDEKKKSIFIKWNYKNIRIPKSQILERINIDNNTYFRIDELTYNKYFRDKPKKKESTSNKYFSEKPENSANINTPIDQKKKKDKIVLLEIKNIINESGKTITVLWSRKSIEIPKVDILDIIKNEGSVTIKMTRAKYKKIFK